MLSDKDKVIDCGGEQLAGLLEDFLADNKSVYCRFRGESMLPTIRDGEVVKIEPIKKAFKRKDVLVYKDRTGSAVSHRLIRISEDEEGKTYLLAADNSFGQTDAVRRKDILGRVSAIRLEGREKTIESMWGRKVCGFLKRTGRNLCLLKQKLLTIF